MGLKKPGTGQEKSGGHVPGIGGSINSAPGAKQRTNAVTSGSGLRTGTKGGKGNSGPAPRKGFRGSTGQENGGGGYAG